MSEIKDSNNTSTWPDLAIGLYDRLTGRGAHINYTFDNLKVQVPSGVGDDRSATWLLDGTISITTSNS